MFRVRESCVTAVSEASSVFLFHVNIMMVQVMAWGDKWVKRLFLSISLVVVNGDILYSKCLNFSSYKRQTK